MCLAAFSIRIIAFGATQKLCRRLIGTASLHLPNVSCVVTASGAFNSNRRKRAQLLLFLADYRYELLRRMLNYFGNCQLNFFVTLLRLLVAAFRASKNKGCFFTTLGFFWLKTGTAFRTKFHIPHTSLLGDSLALILLNFCQIDRTQGVIPEAIRWATRSGSGKLLRVEVNSIIVCASVSESPASPM